MKNILNKIKEPYYILKRYNPIRSTIQGVKNLIKWFIIIWNDRDWDYGWIYEILKFKLECMEKAFRSNNAYSKCSDKRADEIKRCIILLDRLSKDEYELQEDKKLEKKWGKLKISYESIDNDWNKMISTRENIKTLKDEELYQKEFVRSVKKSIEREKQDIDYLFNYIKKHIRGWWD